MLAERLARLLGSILALAMLMGGALLLDEPPAYSTTGYDWTADISNATVDPAPADSGPQAVDAPLHGAF